MHKAARDKTADVEGVANAAKAMASTRRRRSTLAQLTGGGGSGFLNLGELPPMVLLSAAGSLGYDDDGFGGVRENEFGFLKRQGEEAVRASDLEASGILVRSAEIDDVKGEEGLEVQALVGVDAAAKASVDAAVKAGNADAKGAIGKKADPEVKRRRIHPRDLAAYLVACLCGEASASTAAAAPAGERSAAKATVDPAALDKEIGDLETAKASAVAQQEFLKAGELLEQMNRLKEQRAALEGSATGAAGGGKRVTAGSTVDVWTYVESGRGLF